MTNSNSAVIGTAGGTFLSVLPNIHSADILRTVVLATIGAVVSFAISFLLKTILKHFKK
jgi:hypothetical protein